MFYSLLLPHKTSRDRVKTGATIAMLRYICEITYAFYFLACRAGRSWTPKLETAFLTTLLNRFKTAAMVAPGMTLSVPQAKTAVYKESPNVRIGAACELRDCIFGRDAAR
ncbi:hypothetical protein [Burkholderia cenocepacia]|uniref:hypothetical protein n=1 Tax=Burkholderia cenocepacia TaxID=95486 RepID=UPI000F58009D|nr:hypothetical protein [Burkholderia cenocepacia]MBR8305673.1 hypothetical protein [Burkholderia cenocepacia]MEC4771476.1 hypothetical protein [Burkholderia cenocepacia]